MIGAPVILPARWRGDPPNAGDYLSVGTRARYAYRIVDVRRIEARAPKARRYNLALTCLREDPKAVPETATVWRWKWDARRRKARPPNALHG